MEYRIAVIPGDGIGPEIVTEAKKVLDRVGQVFGHTFHYTEVDMGGVSIDKYGVPLTKEALETAKNSDSVPHFNMNTERKRGGRIPKLNPKSHERSRKTARIWHKSFLDTRRSIFHRL